jgi:hypothetical protein
MLSIEKLLFFSLINCCKLLLFTKRIRNHKICNKNNKIRKYVLNKNNNQFLENVSFFPVMIFLSKPNIKIKKTIVLFIFLIYKNVPKSLLIYQRILIISTPN